MPSRKIDLRVVAILLVCGVSFSVSGCGPKKVQAAAPASTAPSASAIETPPPSTIAPDTTALPPVAQEAAAPEIPAASSAVPPTIVAPPSKPAPKPQKPTPEPAASASDEHVRPPAPQISPQLSDNDKANYQRGTREDVGVARNNLQQASGKRLNAQQNDLVDKIQSFLEQSDNASKDGDLARAKNLAQKARLLSVELVNSL